MTIIGLLTTLINAVVSLGERFIDDREKQKEFEAEVRKLLTEQINKIIDLVAEQERLKAQVIIAETKSDSWLTRSWRPIVILVFTTLVVLYWFGVVPANLTQETTNKLFEIIQYALLGYIGGRSVEKTAGKLVQVFLAKKAG